MPSWSQARPWGSKEEQFATQALQAALMSAPEIQETIQPPLPQVNLFPPRFGYRTSQLGIAEIVDVDAIIRAPRIPFGGSPAGYSGASRNAQGMGSW